MAVCPEATSRIRIVATLGGFAGNDPDQHDVWFREGRAVPKWWNSETGEAEPEPGQQSEVLCAQVAFAARFEVEELVVESIHYFHDDDSVEDPFLGDVIQQIPFRLFDDIGYYVLPTRRTWEAAASFASELFRKAVATAGGIPAQNVLVERDRLRKPEAPLELDAGLLPLADRINSQLAQLLPAAPRFQLRVTATDSESLLRALVPHYEGANGVSLPVGRHGMGLLSLQTFILLLELGRERRRQGKPFFFVMEEPELHIPPGLQRRLVAQAVSIAEQTICTSHSPRVAAYYQATSVQILDCRSAGTTSTPLLSRPLDASASNATRKLCHDDRPRVIEALMQHCVLIPEGRSEHEWFRLLVDVLETGEQALDIGASDTPPFGTVVGVIPTHDSAVAETFDTLRRLRSGLVPLLDGDGAGNTTVDRLCAAEQSPDLVLQWREGWAIEDAVVWILKGAESEALSELQERIERKFSSVDEFLKLLKIQTGPGRLKSDYLAYEEVARVIGRHTGCRDRAVKLLAAFTKICLGQHDGSSLMEIDDGRSTAQCVVLRLSP